MKRYFLIFLYSLSLVVLSAFLFGNYFEIPDNTTISWLLQGIYTDGGIAYFPRYLLGWAPLLNQLYQAFPTIPWYGLTLIFCLLITVSNYLYYFSTRYAVNEWKSGLFIFPTIFLWPTMYVDFTTVGILLMASGLALIFLNDAKLLFIGILSILLGSCLRYQIALVGFVLLPVFYLLHDRKIGVRHVFGLMILGSVLLAFNLLQSNEDKTFVEENKWKTIAFDYQQVDLTLHDQALVDVFGNWYFNDANVKEELIPNLERDYLYSLNQKLSWPSVSVWLIELVRSNYVWLVFVLFGIIQRNKKELFVHLYLLAVFISLYMFLKSEERIVLAIGSSIVLCLPDSINRIQKSPLLLIGCVVAVVGSIALGFKRSLHSSEKQAQSELVLNHVSKQSEIIEAGAFQMKASLNPFKVYEPPKMLVLTGWHSNLPQVRNEFKSQTSYSTWDEFVEGADNEFPVFVFGKKSNIEEFENYFTKISNKQFGFVQDPEADKIAPHLVYLKKK